MTDEPDWELMYINLLELQAADCKDQEDHYRGRRQDIEKEIRNLKFSREIQSRNGVTPPGNHRDLDRLEPTPEGSP